MRARPVVRREAFRPHVRVRGAPDRRGGPPVGRRRRCPDETLDACLASDAVFLAAVGDPAFDGGSAGEAARGRASRLSARRSASSRTSARAGSSSGLNGAGPLKPEVARGLDLVIVRELTGGLYYGTPRRLDLAGGRPSTRFRTRRAEIERVAEVAFRLARGPAPARDLRRQVERPRDVAALARPS